MTAVEVFAPAKVNLTLHITGRRADGYHLIDSLVVFAGVGDRLTLTPGGSGRLTITGPEAASLPADESNLVTRQARALGTHPETDCLLEKELPIASGIGGGSADAAAYYRGVAALADIDRRKILLTPEAIAAQWTVGADVPMCIAGTPARVSGIGEALMPVAGLPEWSVVLVNPRIPVRTREVFGDLDCRSNPPMDDLPSTDHLAWLARQRNDLQAPAIRRAPVIATVLAALSGQLGCALARMSGSGATCFGLFNHDLEATRAAEAIAERHPDWWVRASRLDGHRYVAPQAMRSTT